MGKSVAEPQDTYTESCLKEGVSRWAGRSLHFWTGEQVGKMSAGPWNTYTGSSQNSCPGWTAGRVGRKARERRKGGLAG